MFSMIEFALEIVIFPLVDLFVLYEGNVVRWIAGSLFFFGYMIFGVLAAFCFSMGIWPLVLLTCIPAVAFLILDCKNVAERRERRKGNLSTPVDEKALEEELLREKVDEYRNSLSKQF